MREYQKLDTVCLLNLAPPIIISKCISQRVNIQTKSCKSLKDFLSIETAHAKERGTVRPCWGNSKDSKMMEAFWSMWGRPVGKERHSSGVMALQTGR